jgi:hypothetical protein
MARYFFSATESAHGQLTGLFDFVWATAAAMWNLRWQVNGYIEAVPSATVEQLRARFAEGADINGANFHRACVDHTWEQQKEAFASVLLVNSIALFEGWLDEVLNQVGKNTKQISKSLQFPDSTATGGKGVLWALSEINVTESLELKSAFYGPLSKSKYWDPSRLDAWFLCYRYFKELRNCTMHRGGFASQSLVDGFSNFSTVATPSGLGVKEVPRHDVPILDVMIRPSLRGVVGFTGILIKIIVTLDAEFSRSHLSERAFVSKWKTANPHKKMLSANQAKRAKQIKKLAENARFPVPDNVHKFGDWLRDRGLSQF